MRPAPDRVSNAEDGFVRREFRPEAGDPNACGGRTGGAPARRRRNAHDERERLALPFIV
ncbi:MAG: hypothetical protein HSCHL_2388 [Hydrogenibacillus schlegelii]|uniref:Uncharacterized protein n=1 Tax=Hydrogenibacillus schlegelii TaxID=1484 RepID=A0A2T5GF31_HYDSH|nr:MAG: hypothetical protein HSCHL_2388 [Hydrogenibacillus schlegelii]